MFDEHDLGLHRNHTPLLSPVISSGLVCTHSVCVVYTVCYSVCVCGDDCLLCVCGSLA